MSTGSLSGSPAPGGSQSLAGGGIEIVSPCVDDGVQLWRLASGSTALDANSRYAYLLWCRDFADTSVIARRCGGEGTVLGFITGYRRLEAPDTLFVWQIAVEDHVGGEGLAAEMLDCLIKRVEGVDHLETTVTAQDWALVTLFARFARRWDAEVDHGRLFDEELLGAGHPPENRLRIGPLPTTARPGSVS
jgi:L-2,4-diaminobutyric acid acetyltransferase